MLSLSLWHFHSLWLIQLGFTLNQVNWLEFGILVEKRCKINKTMVFIQSYSNDCTSIGKYKHKY